jgi:GTP-binding protein Era
LLPHLKFLSSKIEAVDFVPLSALRKTNLDELEDKIKGYMPDKMHLFPEDQITDRSERFLAAEIVREKITRQLGAEVPYQVTVEIEEFRAEKNITHISALILVERDGQKKIIIGTNGERIKKIGAQARADMESLLDCKVMLRTWVKVRSGWSDDERALRSLGYMDE